MKSIVFSIQEFDREALTNANQHLGHQLTFVKPRLDPTTAPLRRGYTTAIVFVNEQLDAETLEILRSGGDTTTST